MVQVVLPNDANPLGFILGGTVMHLIDIAGAIACHRHTRTLLVTAAVDDLQFLHSIKVGDLIILKSRVTCAFTTSLEVQVDVFSEETLTGMRQLTSTRVPDLRRHRSRRREACRCRRCWWRPKRSAACAKRRTGDARARLEEEARSTKSERYEADGSTSYFRLQTSRLTKRSSAGEPNVPGRCRRGNCSGTCARRCRRAGSRAARSARSGSARRPGSSCS